MSINIGDVVRYSDRKRVAMNKLGMRRELVYVLGEVSGHVDGRPAVAWQDGTFSVPDLGVLTVVTAAKVPTIVGKMVAGGKRYYFKRIRRFAHHMGQYRWVEERNQATPLTPNQIAELVPLLAHAEVGSRVFTA